MIEDLHGYTSYLENKRKLGVGTISSYVSNLERLSKALNIEISPQTASTSEQVRNVLDNFQLTSKGSWNNCQSALNAYSDFLKQKHGQIAQLSRNEIKLLDYLVSHVKYGDVRAHSPETYLPYSKVLQDLGFPNDGKTPGESLNRHAMAGLAEWLKSNNLPAITGIIINNKNHQSRPLMPSESYFTFHGVDAYDFQWHKTQVEQACKLDWNQELARWGLGLTEEFTYAEEIDSSFIEGAQKQITVNAYERNLEARNACIKEYGTRCCVCNFSFFEFYGKRGEAYIHIHHLTPLSEIKSEYEIDPIKDLRPVCPNCHAMLHRFGNISIDELKEEIEFNKAIKR